MIRGLKELGAFGMKIDEKYGGLGLTQVYYNKALAMVGTASPAVGALLSAHQSIGVPQPLKMFGTKEQKDAFLPRCARTDISAFLLTEPDVGSDPARLATTAVPDGDDYVLDGVKLWTTNGVVADLLVVMARVPASDGPQGRHHRLRGRGRLRGHHGGEPQRLHGPARHRERRHPLPPGAGPGRQPDRPRGRRPEDRPDHAQHRPAVAARGLRAARASGA